MGGHLPTLDLVAGRSYSKSDSDQMLDVASLPGVDSKLNDRQIGLQLTVPIFSGGFTQSKVRQNEYLWIAAKEAVVQSSRATEREAHDAYLGVISGIARVQALRQALESSQTALKATEAGYEVGTRTAVDVLNARKTLVQAETDYSNARYDYIVSVLQLRLAAGTLDRAQLIEVNSYLTASAPMIPAAVTPENVLPTVPAAAPVSPGRPAATGRSTAGRNATGRPRLRRRRRLGQERLDQREQLRQRAAVARDTVAPGRADALARRGVGEQRRQAPGQFRRRTHHLCSAPLDQQPRNLGAVEVVRPGEDRDAQGGGLEQIVPPHRDEAAADEGHIRRRVEVEQLTERIEQQHFIVGFCIRQRAAGEAHARLRQRLCGFREARPMARRHHQQRPRPLLAHAPHGIDERLLFATAVRTTGHPQRPLRGELAAQRRAARRDIRRQLKVELQVARDVRTGGGGAECAEALGIGAVLGGHHGDLPERIAEEPSEALVAPDRTRRDARARQHQRNAPPPAGAIQVRPQLGLEDHRQPRLHAPEEAAYRARQIKGYVAHLRNVAEQCPRPRSPGGGEGGDGERQLRMGAPQRAHQRRACLHFADRDGVHPHPAGRGGRAEAEALAEVAPVGTIPQPPPQQQH